MCFLKIAFFDMGTALFDKGDINFDRYHNYQQDFIESSGTQVEHTHEIRFICGELHKVDLFLYLTGRQSLCHWVRTKELLQSSFPINSRQRCQFRSHSKNTWSGWKF